MLRIPLLVSVLKPLAACVRSHAYVMTHEDGSSPSLPTWDGMGLASMQETRAVLESPFAGHASWP